MGHLEQFAKDTFAEETPRITRGAIRWDDPPEVRLTRVQGDGLLRVYDPALMGDLADPWPQARKHDEVPLEIKMAGDHLDVKAIERLLLRRQARQVQRVEDEKNRWEGQVPIWVVAPHVPDVLHSRHKSRQFAPGCYRVTRAWFEFLWIAANELPLRDELVPFLVARSGAALDEFARWVAPRRPLDWVLNMVEYTRMSTTVREELLRKFGWVDDPEIEARRQQILRALLEASPKVKEELVAKGMEQGIEQGSLLTARSVLRRVLARRQLALTPDQEGRIQTCTDPATLERWLDQALTAATAAEALS